MKISIPTWVKPAFWGVILGALAWWAILAWQFGWVSGGAADRMAEAQAQNAVVAYATPACVARFKQQPDAAVAWQKLKGTDSWKQDDAVRDGGWIGLPDQKLDPELATAIAEACTPKILALTDIGTAQTMAN
jgi:hypothetical protein